MRKYVKLLRQLKKTEEDYIQLQTESPFNAHKGTNKTVFIETVNRLRLIIITQAMSNGINSDILKSKI